MSNELMLLLWGATLVAFLMVIYPKKVASSKLNLAMKPEPDFSKGIVVLIFATIIIFTVTVLYLAYLGTLVPDSLIVSFMGVMSVEFFSLAFIKTKKKEIE